MCGEQTLGAITPCEQGVVFEPESYFLHKVETGLNFLGEKKVSRGENKVSRGTLFFPRGTLFFPLRRIQIYFLVNY